MDSKSHKFYHIHGMDSRDFSDLYCSGKEDMVFGEDTLIFPMKNLHYQFSSGRVKGKFLIDVSNGSIIHHLYSASKCFQKIVVLKSSEKCIMELSRWLNDRTGAYDWTHTSAAAAELEGNSSSVTLKFYLYFWKFLQFKHFVNVLPASSVFDLLIDVSTLTGSHDYEMMSAHLLAHMSM
ncbi:indolethylamine N-methyltransferase-like [Mantella aurantiaca]